MPQPTDGFLAEDGRFFKRQDDCAYYEFGVRLQKAFFEELEKTQDEHNLAPEAKAFLFAKATEFLENNAELVRDLSECFTIIQRRIRKDASDEMAGQSTTGVSEPSERVRGGNSSEVGANADAEDFTQRAENSLGAIPPTEPVGMSPRKKRYQLPDAIEIGTSGSE